MVDSPAPRLSSDASLSRDARLMGLVGLAHGTSHFFHLLLPPLFPLWVDTEGATYGELGFLVTLFFAVSGVGQAMSGFLVDRWGAFRVLCCTQLCFMAAALVAFGAQGYAGWALAAVLAGMGNAPMHPADFSLLNRSIHPTRLGHAYAVHGISGTLGWAVAPLVIGSVTVLTGSWRLAMLVCAVWAACMVALLWWHRILLQEPPPAEHRIALPTVSDKASAAASAAPAALGFLQEPSVWLCFLFFFWSTCALAAVQSFIGPALDQQHAGPQPWWPLVVTAYMVLSAVGMVVGGFLLRREASVERLIRRSLLAAAALVGVAGTGFLGPVPSALAVAFGGLAVGLAGPSRDMLVRNATPPGATGRVVGLVYSGLDLGFAAAAPVLGGVLDRGYAAGIFGLMTAALLAAVLCASAVGHRLNVRKDRS